MPIIDNINLYNQVKDKAKKIYEKNSGFRSGYIQKEYKRLGGTFTNDGKEKNLSRWYAEKWQSIGGKYPTYRPSIRINEMTPKTINEIDKKEAKKQIILKQKIKGKSNLPKFL